jgi:hypothetical protein
MLRFSLTFLTIIPLLISCTNSGRKDWGKVWVGIDSLGYHEAFLENDRIRIRYGYGMGEEEPESFITEAILKSKPEINLAGALLDAAAHRGLITRAEVVKDSVDEKSIYLEWAPVPGMKEQFPGPARCLVSIFKDSAVLKIQYIDFCFAHICDIGLERTPKLDAAWGGRIRVYGYERDTLPQYEDCLYYRTYGFVGCEGVHALHGIEGDPAPLSYKGWMIMGTWDPKNNAGFGRVLPAENIRAIKLLWNKGFELFPGGKNFTGYIYFFENGESQVLAGGKNIVDKMITNSF